MVINDFPQLKTEGGLSIGGRHSSYSNGLACWIQFRPDSGPRKFYFDAISTPDTTPATALDVAQQNKTF
jgi:hypothetical protein